MCHRDIFTREFGFGGQYRDLRRGAQSASGHISQYGGRAHAALKAMFIVLGMGVQRQYLRSLPDSGIRGHGILAGLVDCTAHLQQCDILSGAIIDTPPGQTILILMYVPCIWSSAVLIRDGVIGIDYHWPVIYGKRDAPISPQMNRKVFRSQCVLGRAARRSTAPVVK